MSADAAAVQLNVRMDAELKAAGDAVLESEGVSPSQLIRALWARIAQGPHAFEQVVLCLVERADSSMADEKHSVSELATTVRPATLEEHIALSRQVLYEAVGMSSDHLPPYPQVSEEELMWEYWEDWERERMAWHE